jgi:membrane protein DedA with SNARE-associated domain
MNIENFQPALDWIINNPTLTYCLIFLISLSESLVVIGLIIPGIAIMSIIGTLMGAGYLKIWPTMLASITGAIIGDSLSYWIGQKFQQSIRDWWIFRKCPEIIIRCEQFFAKHGGKSIIFGRFVGPVRPMIPSIAGMMKMPPKYFFTVNVFSALLWAPVYLIPGALFGSTLATLPAEVSKKILYIVISCILFIWFTIKIIQSISYAIRRRYRKIGTQLWFYIENNSIYFLQKIIRHPLTHKKHQIDSFLFLLTLLIITIIFILFTKFRFLTTSLNAFFKHLSLLIFEPNVYKVLLTIDSYSSIFSLLLIFSAFTLYFALTNYTSGGLINLRRTLSLSVSLLVSYFIVTFAISYFIQYPKPFQIDYEYSLFSSFPNLSLGLLTLTIGYIGIIRFCNDPKAYKNSNYAFYAASIIILFLIIKLILGYTWLSDLNGAILISSCLLLIFCIIYWQNPIENINIKQLNTITLLFILITIVCNTTVIYFYSNLELYNLKKLNQNIEYESITVQEWQQQDNLFKDIKEPIINIQWLADKNFLLHTLKQKGWYKQPDFTFTNMLLFLKNEPQITELPLLPVYYQDHHASITVSKIDTNNKIINLRLWESEYKINKVPIWIGTIQYLKPQKFFNILTVLDHWPRAEFADAMNKLEQDIKKNTSLATKIIYDEHYFIDEELKIMLIN